MKRKLVVMLLSLASVSSVFADVTLEECQSLAQENYPLIKQFELVSRTENLNLEDINKGWLPRLGLYAQGTVQNVVPQFPESLSHVMAQMNGGSIKGLGKFQYKIGLDVNQTIWDGGASKSQREITHAQTEQQRAALDVEMYAIRDRVQSLYFGILLIEQQIVQSEDAVKVLEANLDRLRSMLKGGVVMQSDVDMVEAQLLTARQQIIQAKSANAGYRRMLGIFIDKDMTGEVLTRPSAVIPAELTSERPELKLFASRDALVSARRSLVDVSLMPKIGFFAQAYYGYPGIDYFKAMMERDPTFNILAGVKASWNIDSFYTKKNQQSKLALEAESINNDRELFLFNTKMQSASQLEGIRGIQDMMKEDNLIVELRRNVRKAAESQLQNGVIDATSLLTKINDETQASLTAGYHDIQLLQNIYNLKYTLNK